MISSGSYSHAEGGNSKSSGRYSHAEGQTTIANGNAMHAQGKYNKLDDTVYPDWVASKSYVVGDKVTYNGNGYTCKTANSDATFTFSKWTYESNNGGEVAFVIGNGTGDSARSNAFLVKWDGSVQEGGGTTASGGQTHAEGQGTQASGSGAHAEGTATQATGNSSHAEGGGSRATEYASHAEGGSTLASGNSSHAEGYGTIANGFAMHAQGKYNKSDDGDVAFVIGNGTKDDARSNAFAVKWNGTTTAAGDVYANNTKKLATEEYVNTAVAGAGGGADLTSIENRLAVLEGDEDTEGSVAEAKAQADLALEEARACVYVDQGTANSGHHLWVDGDGNVNADMPSWIMFMDSSRTKTFVITFGSNGELTVSEKESGHSVVKEVYNYKSADDALEYRIKALEDKVAALEGT